MRQVPIEQFKRSMNEDIKDLPFEVTRRGKFLFYVTNHVVDEKFIIKPSLNHVVESKKVANHVVGAVKTKGEATEKLTKIIKKKQGTDISETTIDTGERPVIGYPKPYQCRKKKK